MSIAIWGMGISGNSALKFILSTYKGDIFLINQGDPALWSVDLDLGGRDIKCFDQSQIPTDLKVDKIILAAGIDPRIPELIPFKDTPKVCNEEYAFLFIDKPIIAVTGTNGKTTTVTLLAQALEAAGKKVFLGGNIGTPLCEMLCDNSEYDYIVLELSSFQLELMDKFHAQVSVILNISKTHMERYDNFNDYKQAKLDIVMNQVKGDLFITPGDFMSTETLALKKAIAPVEGYEFNNPALIGAHHQRNFKVVDDVLDYFGIPSREEIIQNLINNFKGVKYRLEYLGLVNEVKFYNDAKSTNTEATVSAVTAFDEPLILIMGGKLRDESQELRKAFESIHNIIKIYAIGDAAKYIYDNLSDRFEVECLDDLELVFEKLKDIKCDAIVFSPAFPSFDQYKNYIARGEDFENRFKLLYTRE